MTDALVLFGVGLLAGVVNSLAGGGSLLTLPALMFLGLPAGVANGTNRVAVLLQSLVATRRYAAEGILETSLGWRILVPAGLGSSLGAWASVDLDDDLFRQIIGMTMLLMVGLMWLKPKQWLEGRQGDTPPHLWWSGPLCFFVIGLYAGFLQAGVGVFLLAGLVLLYGQDLLQANALKVMLVAGFTLPPLAIFIAVDQVRWGPGLVLALGSMIGADLGARLSIAGGAALIRWAVLVMVALSASKLLEMW